MTDWRTIETCPVDDIPINPGVLLWNGEIVTVGWFCDEHGWQNAIDAPEYSYNTLNPPPTHWAPLPGPPK